MSDERWKNYTCYPIAPQLMNLYRVAIHIDGEWYIPGTSKPVRKENLGEICSRSIDEIVKENEQLRTEMKELKDKNFINGLNEIKTEEFEDVLKSISNVVKVIFKKYKETQSLFEEFHVIMESVDKALDKVSKRSK